jgi:hypothetical protein
MRALAADAAVLVPDCKVSCFSLASCRAFSLSSSIWRFVLLLRRILGALATFH